MLIFLFVWLIGYLFTIGFTINPNLKCPLLYFITFFLWPIYLGEDIRLVLSPKKN